MRWAVCGALAVLCACGSDGDPPFDDPAGSGGAGGDAGGGGEAGQGGTAPVCDIPVPEESGVVATDAGPVRGALDGAVWSFRGIPFATPPLGALRFAEPEPHGCFDDVLQADAFGAACPQIALDSDGEPAGVSGEEDCLTLNVWIPDSVDEPRPVLFFIHGGGNVQGSSAQTTPDGVAVYDGSALAAQQDVVVVTANYRLGWLGYLVHDDLAREAGGVSGNQGLRDQLLALDWVQRNIAAFGGDPTRVMVFGESAGAVNVCNLVASPLAAGLFSSAIMQSGACTAAGEAQQQSLADDLVAAAGCDTDAQPIACLRALGAEALLLSLPTVADVVAVGAAMPGPVIDGALLPSHPIDIVESGAHNHVPIVVGVNSDETSRWVGPIASEAAFDAALLAYAGGNQPLAALIEAQYPVSDYDGSYRRAFVALTSDAKFVCTTRYTARAFDIGQAQDVYRYYFTHALDGDPLLAALGAWHGLELAFVFGHLDVGGYLASPAEAQLSLAMGSYWAAFAGGDAEAFVPWEPATDPYLQLDDPISTGSGIRTAQCDFWDTIYP